jgi:hypothetical protein
LSPICSSLHTLHGIEVCSLFYRIEKKNAPSAQNEFFVNYGGLCPPPPYGGLLCKNFRMEVLNMSAATLTPQRGYYER